MDNIFVDDGSLKNALSELENLQESTIQATDLLCSSCSSVLSDLDAGLQQDILSFLEAAQNYQQSINLYVEQNTRALEERLEKMAAYNEL